MRTRNCTHLEALARKYPWNELKEASRKGHAFRRKHPKGIGCRMPNIGAMSTNEELLAKDSTPNRDNEQLPHIPKQRSSGEVRTNVERLQHRHEPLSTEREMQLELQSSPNLHGPGQRPNAKLPSWLAFETHRGTQLLVGSNLVDHNLRADR